MKRVIAVLLLAILVLGFTGCGSAAISSSFSSNSTESSTSSLSSESSSEVSEVFDPAAYTIAICMSSINHPIHRIVQLGFIESAQTLGYKDILVSGLVEGGFKEITENWDNDVTEKHISGIAVWTGDDSCYELMKKWHDQGIKIVVPYFEHSYDYTHEFIGANIVRDPHAIASAAVDFLVETLEEKGITGGGLGSSQIGDSSYSDGFHDRIAELGTEFTLLDTVFEGAEIEQSATIIESYIKNNPTMVGAFGMSGNGASAWSHAKVNAGREDIIVITLDYTAQNLEILQNGGITAIMAQSTYECGYESTIKLDELLRGTIFDEDSWSSVLGFHVITSDGEGMGGISFYDGIVDRAEALDWDKYLT